MAKAQAPRELATVYNPQGVEENIYRFWESRGYFTPHGNPAKPYFSVVMPPPNVTGSLHIGHAWDNTLQDIIVRYKRLQGYDVLWVPGTDHAGIATQTKVEKHLRETEGKSRHDIGRDTFVERVWEWKQQYGDIITNQIRKLGASCDWSRERFTMDEGLSKAVREVFVQLYDKGLIYRGKRIINWCPRCGTALSDIEVDHVDVASNLYYVRYPLSDGSGSLTIATTRPETMFADVAVAVHPADPRYAGLVGKTVRLPLTDRVLPIVADDYVDMEYGTGCLKITPAHDVNDFEVGQRHHLDMPQCIDADGRLNDLAGAYAGAAREEARELVASQLQDEGYLARTEAISHAVGHCSRCGTAVEPFLSEQWFVAMRTLADRALAGVEKGLLNFVPQRFEKVFLHWLHEVRDWCISRQLWWGHRIPAWFCEECGEVTVSRTQVERCCHCQSTNLRQEEDVLDTWFSSALWPFSTMGWPDGTADMQRYYPTSALMTGYDILFFWVARMVFTGLEFTGEMPFQDVILHGLIRAADGRKMSKSLGNGVDPLEVIQQYGADSLRFMLSTGTTPGNDQRFQYERLESARNFINKIWNASRFVIMNLPETLQGDAPNTAELRLEDRWILHRLNETANAVTQHLNRYDFGEAGRCLYDFTWDDFCDWYIEFSKLSLYGDNVQERQHTQHILLQTLNALLRLLHPFIPFVTEEIWQVLPNTGEALIVAQWPAYNPDWKDDEAERKVSLVQDVIRAVRNIRSELQVAPGKEIVMLLKTQSGDFSRLFESVRPYVSRFCQLSRLEIGEGLGIPEQCMTAVVTGGEIYLPLSDLVDLEVECARLEKEQQRLEGEVRRLEQKLANSNFVQRAPVAVVEGEREKLTDYETKLMRVLERLASLR